jgi:hypothetical protein
MYFDSKSSIEINASPGTEKIIRLGKLTTHFRVSIDNRTIAEYSRASPCKQVGSYRRMETDA